MIKIRELYPSEIECRVAQSGTRQNGSVYASYLLYKDARVDMKVLDETFGPLNWQREHAVIGNRLYCTISIYDSEKKEWVRKQDVGTESNAEPEKGQASDSFKRAGFNVGIGRELYSAPSIFVDLQQGEYKSFTGTDKKVRITPTLSLSVKHIHCGEDGNIDQLVLVDKRGNPRFEFGVKGKAKSTAPAPTPAPTPTPASPAATQPVSAPAQKPRIIVGGKAWHSALEKHARGEDMTGEMEKRYAITDNEWDMFFEAVNTYKRENGLM